MSLLSLHYALWSVLLNYQPRFLATFSLVTVYPRAVVVSLFGHILLWLLDSTTDDDLHSLQEMFTAIK
jgi:hypothetical protein